MITIAKLKALLPEPCYLTHLWKADGERCLRMSVYCFPDSHLGFSSRYRCHFELSHNGKILAVKNEHDAKPDLSTEYQKLVGKRIDLNSFEYYYEKEVTDCPASLYKQEILGRVQGGRFVAFGKHTDRPLPMLRKTYLGRDDAVEEYGEYQYAKWFRDFVKKHKMKIANFEVVHEHGTEFIYNFKIGKKKVRLVLLQFFSYSLTAFIDGKKYENEKVISLFPT